MQLKTARCNELLLLPEYQTLHPEGDLINLYESCADADDVLLRTLFNSGANGVDSINETRVAKLAVSLQFKRQQLTSHIQRTIHSKEY